MSCPPEDALLQWVLTSDGSPLDEELRSGWTAPDIESHTEACPSCCEQADSWQQSLSDWKAAGLVASEGHDDRFFDALSARIEETLDGAQPTAGTGEQPLRPVRELPTSPNRRPLWTALAAAGAAALLWTAVPTDPDGPTRSSTELADRGAGAEDAETDSLEAAARDLGRRALSMALAEDTEDDSQQALFTQTAALLDEEEPFSYLFTINLYDAIADLTAEEATALAAQL